MCFSVWFFYCGGEWRRFILANATWMAVSRRLIRIWIPPARRMNRRWGAWGEKRTIAAADEPAAPFDRPPDAVFKYRMADLPFLIHSRIAKKLARNVAVALTGIFTIERYQCIAK